MTPRAALPEDIQPLAQLWFDAWHETQAPHVPAALINQRTFESFKIRLSRMGDLLRAAGPIGAPVGLCAIKAGELHQLFIAPAARGTGIAMALLADAEQRLIALGHTSARLECLIENDAARRFYRRNGWVEKGIETAHLDTLDGPFALPCMIFVKELAA
ncbi:MAG: GNAT family N-acetyltransferase [Octadecabacter sp.]